MAWARYIHSFGFLETCVSYTHDVLLRLWGPYEIAHRFSHTNSCRMRNTSCLEISGGVSYGRPVLCFLTRKHLNMCSNVQHRWKHCLAMFYIWCTLGNRFANPHVPSHFVIPERYPYIVCKGLNPLWNGLEPDTCSFGFLETCCSFKSWCFVKIVGALGYRPSLYSYK